MRPYQLQGLNWLVSLHHNSLNGILADEMVRTYCVMYQLRRLKSEWRRVLAKPSKPSLFLPISSTNDHFPACTLSLYQNPRCKIGRVNSRGGRRTSISRFLRALKKNAPKSSQTGSCRKTSKSVLQATKSA